MAERVIGQVKTDDGTAVPVVTWRGERPGPTVMIVAGIHGDELVGTAACGRLDAKLRAGLAAGTVHLVPSANPVGLAARTRTVGPDGGDLNRVFPGGEGRTLADRLAASLWRDLTARLPDAVVDLHADAGNALPYAIVDRAVDVPSPTRAALERRATALATATGLTVLHEYPVEVYQRFGLDRSLAGAAMNRARIPAVTLELGARRVVDPVAVDTAVTATLGVLHALGLGFEPAPTHPTILADGPWRRGSGPRVGRDGWLTPEVAPGVRVKAKQRIAVVRDLVGEIVEIVTAVDDGVVVSWVDGGWVSIGQAVGTFAVQERR